MHLLRAYIPSNFIYLNTHENLFIMIYREHHFFHLILLSDPIPPRPVKPPVPSPCSPYTQTHTYIHTHTHTDSGPGVSTVSLDEGMELLAEYKIKIAKLLKTKAELINAQNLFRSEERRVGKECW